MNDGAAVTTESARRFCREPRADQSARPGSHVCRGSPRVKHGRTTARVRHPSHLAPAAHLSCLCTAEKSELSLRRESKKESPGSKNAGGPDLLIPAEVRYSKGYVTCTDRTWSKEGLRSTCYSKNIEKKIHFDVFLTERCRLCESCSLIG